MGAIKPPATSIPSLEELSANPVVEVIGNDEPLVEIAFDISSTCVGMAIGVDKDYKTHAKLVFKTTAGRGEKLLAFEHWLKQLFAVFQPDRCYVEKVVNRKGSTTRRHSELHGILYKTWYVYKNAEIKKSWLIGSNQVKNALNVKKGRNHEHNKEIMVHKINDLLGLGLQFHPNSKYISDDDPADAIAVLFTVWRRNARR